MNFDREKYIKKLEKKLLDLCSKRGVPLNNRMSFSFSVANIGNCHDSIRLTLPPLFQFVKESRSVGYASEIISVLEDIESDFSKILEK